MRVKYLLYYLPNFIVFVYVLCVDNACFVAYEKCLYLFGMLSVFYLLSSILLTGARYVVWLFISLVKFISKAPISAALYAIITITITTTITITITKTITITMTITTTILLLLIIIMPLLIINLTY